MELTLHSDSPSAQATGQLLRNGSAACAAFAQFSTREHQKRAFLERVRFMRTVIQSLVFVISGPVSKQLESLVIKTLKPPS
jgi:hypothetical protein